jgi:hypothetical protein
MARIVCPSCNKQISSRARICSYCGEQFAEVSEDDLRLYQARRLRDRIYRLSMLSYLVIAVLVAAFGWFWWETRGFVQPSSVGPFILTGVAALAYAVVRVLLYQSRKERRTLRERQRMSRELRRNL